jgi:hypothetical protein
MHVRISLNAHLFFNIERITDEKLYIERCIGYTEAIPAVLSDTFPPYLQNNDNNVT